MSMLCWVFFIFCYLDSREREGEFALRKINTPFDLSNSRSKSRIIDDPIYSLKSGKQFKLKELDIFRTIFSNLRANAFVSNFSQCLLYIVYTFSNLIAPVVLHKLGTKLTLFTSVACFGVYASNFILIRNYIYFPCCAIAGLGLACKFSSFFQKFKTSFSIFLQYRCLYFKTFNRKDLIKESGSILHVDGQQVGVFKQNFAFSYQLHPHSLS